MSSWTCVEIELSFGNSYSLSRIRLRECGKAQDQQNRERYSLVNSLDLFRLKGRTTDDERVQNDTD